MLPWRSFQLSGGSLPSLARPLPSVAPSAVPGSALGPFILTVRRFEYVTAYQPHRSNGPSAPEPWRFRKAYPTTNVSFTRCCQWAAFNRVPPLVNGNHGKAYRLCPKCSKPMETLALPRGKWQRTFQCFDCDFPDP
jgi:hypothetical protein